MGRKRQLIALVFAALAVAARLPLLLSHKIAFDSDEAVEGLMARHVLHGELPAFFWGQAFKGVPEVYASAGAFAIFGSSVTTLKSVTLAFFAAYVALNFVLLDKIAGRWTAAAASLLLIVCPPALVFWSLDASAEYVILMLLGTLFILLCVEKTEHQRRSTTVLAAIGIVIGLALWVQQLFVIYLLPAAIILLGPRLLRSGKDIRRLRPIPATIAGIAALYLALAAIAFVTGGFSLAVGPYALGVRAPQKLLRVAAAAAALAGLLQVWHNTPREARRNILRDMWPAGAGFLAGYSPAILYSILVEPVHSPLRNANLHQLLQASPDIFGNVIPIIFGFTLATTERLRIPVIAAVPGVTALLAYVWAHRGELTQNLASGFFPLFVIAVPVVFLVSGAYLDTQSYRYLIPWYGGLTVAWAGGSLALANATESGRAQRQMRRTIAAIVVGTIVAVHAWQQVLWYQGLGTDTESIATLDCFRRAGIRGGYADYWTSYKLTFLSKEDIIIAPTNGVDRYPKYTAFVRSLPPAARADGIDCR